MRWSLRCGSGGVEDVSYTAWQHGLTRNLDTAGRSGRAEEVAWPVTWLYPPGAAHVTGQCRVVDGGNAVAEGRRV